MKRLSFAALAVAAAVGLAGCGQKVDTEAAPVSGEALSNYSENVKDKVQLGKDSGLVQLFCMHGTGAKCGEGIEARLKEYGFDGSGTTLDLADAMVKMNADDHDKTNDQFSTDEQYFASAYQVVLGRAPDKEGAVANLDLIKQSADNRRHVVRAMIESEEFKNMAAPAPTAPPPAP